MKIVYHEESKVFHLWNENISYVMMVLPNGHLGQLYFGKRIHDRNNMSDMLELAVRPMSGASQLWQRGLPQPGSGNLSEEWEQDLRFSVPILLYRSGETETPRASGNLCRGRGGGVHTGRNFEGFSDRDLCTVMLHHFCQRRNSCPKCPLSE